MPPSLYFIFIALAAGYAARRAGWVDSARARPIMVFIQKFVTPGVLLLSFWGLKPASAFLVVVLPIAGVLSITVQTSAALLCANALRLKGPARGSFLVGALLSNIGYLGWTVNLSLFGRTGFDTAFMYGFYFNFAVYLVAYPIAARYGTASELRALPFLKRVLVENILLYGLAAVSAGAALNLAGVPLPEALRNANAALVPIVTALLMFAAGLTVNVSSFRAHALPSAVLCGIKMVLSPLAAAAALAVVSSRAPLDPVMVRVILIEATTPLAIVCLSISSIFRLDQDLTNCMWLFSTVAFFVVFQGVFFALR